MDNVTLIGREPIDLSQREILMLATVEPLLRKARVSLFCPKCWAQGLGDGGLRGNNHESDTQWTLECACTVRRAANPVHTANPDAA